MNKIITAARIRWGVIAIIYAVFLFWYGRNRSPMTKTRHNPRKNDKR